MKKLIIPAFVLTVDCARHGERAERLGVGRGNRAAFARGARFRQASHRAPVPRQHQIRLHPQHENFRRCGYRGLPREQCRYHFAQLRAQLRSAQTHADRARSQRSRRDDGSRRHSLRGSRGLEHRKHLQAAVHDRPERDHAEGGGAVRSAASKRDSNCAVSPSAPRAQTDRRARSLPTQ
jgi:hypothetical protein